MRKRSGQVYSRESSATLQLTVSLLYQQAHVGLDLLTLASYNKSNEILQYRTYVLQGDI